MTIDALRLEVKKDKWEQLQNGTYKLQVTVNPADLNDNADDVLLQFIKAGMGERFMMGVAKIGEDEQAEPAQKPPEKPKERKQWGDTLRSMQAAIRVTSREWRHWAKLPDTWTADDCTNWIKQSLVIQSRKELDSDPGKSALWDKMDAAFIEATRLPERH